MRLISFLALCLLSGCDTLGQAALHTVMPTTGTCVANGVTWKFDFPNGGAHYGAGCVEQRPYPGMARPGHGQ